MSDVVTASAADAEVAEAAEAAEAAGLVYLSDDVAGLSRRRAGTGFSYRWPDGTRVTDEHTLRRVKALAIPPAWSDVWISPDPRSHLQATGWDARGRKQYRYHAGWRKVRDEAKFERLAGFGRALPALRAQVAVDLARRDLSRRRVDAALVELLDRTLIRVGNEEYARANGSFGLTTLRDEHACIAGSRIELAFRAKGGKVRTEVVTDRRLARLVRRCQELPGQVLFQYVDEGGVVRPIGSREVNDYLHEVTGGPFTAKDFRTWGASVAVLSALREADPPPPSGRGAQAQARRTVVSAIAMAATRLANTPAVCRTSYVHPAVITGYPEQIAMLTDRAGDAVLAGLPGLEPDEARLLALIDAAEGVTERRLDPTG